MSLYDFQVTQPVETVAKHMEAFLQASLKSLEPLVAAAKAQGVELTLNVNTIDANTFATEVTADGEATVTTFTLSKSAEGTTVSVDTTINGQPPEFPPGTEQAVEAAKAQGAAQLAAGLTEFIAAAEAEGPGIE